MFSFILCFGVSPFSCNITKREGEGGLNAAFEMFHFYDYGVPGPFGRCPAFLSVSSKTCKMLPLMMQENLSAQIWTLLLVLARDRLSEKDVRGG